ncbi:MAG: response regulator [Rhodocyclaceae bacterium]|nr:response regulator [Rhodocyclaceae bacterium]
MSATTHIAVVDDNPPQRMILTRLLENEYQVSAFETGAQFLASVSCFDAILLDIEMPGLNGYDTCRSLRNRDECCDIPVIFVSAHDTAPERVAAYEAGGDDFVTKPINAHELRHKLKGAIEHRQRVSELAAQSSTAQQVAFTAMISMGDLGVVIDFLRHSTENRTYDAIADQVISAMAAWGLQGVVQVRGRSGHLDRSSSGDMSPLQESVLDNMRNIGRIFEFGSRAIINYEHVSLLIQNLPTDDPDKVGRLRDHLAVLAESADMRVAALDAVNDRKLQKVGIEVVLAEFRSTLARINEKNHGNLTKGQSHMLEALEHLSRTLSTLGLTEIQESYVDDLVKETLDETWHYFDEAQSLESEFSEVLNRLERLAIADYRL